MAFLSKVFGRKKHDDKASSSSSASSPSPLQEKFEYVIPSQTPVTRGHDYPHLSLNLPERRESRVLSNVFGNEDLVGKTRLSPEQTLVIVRACSQAIIARGLETLGIMHPHWHSASPATQQRLILLFIQSSAAVFESEIASTRSPHDVAAVLRWAYRHLQLSSFGNDSDWYRNFFEAEKSASYPAKSFSEILAPQLPATNLELLTTTLDLFSSLAAHSESNSISGSKLSKFFGLWLLAAERSAPSDDFISFYNQWDKQGRILEHLFLSHIRNEVVSHRMPKRLTELVKHYPYAKQSQLSPENDLLPRPRFSTRRYDALFVHIATENPITKPSKISLQMVADALNAATPNTNDTQSYLVWRKIQQMGNAVDDELMYSPTTGKYPEVGRVLSDETMGILSLLEGEILPESSINFIQADNNRYGTTESSNTRSTSSHTRHLSASSSDASIEQRPSMNTSLNTIGLDWNSFSTSGFLQSTPLLTPLAETLLESKDTEVTSSSVTPSRKGSKKSAKTPTHQSRRSLDTVPPITIPPLSIPGPQVSNSGAPNKCNSRVTKVELVPLDEAFIDFWSDSVLDPITDAEAWPKFVVCRLKANAVPELDGKKIEWMVVEQEYVKPVPTPPVPRSPSAGTSANGGTEPETVPASATVESASSPKSGSRRASSPRPSLSSVNASVKRFSFWSKKDKGEKEDTSPTKRRRKNLKGKEKEVESIEKNVTDSEVEEVGGGSLPISGVAAVATGVVAAGVVAAVAETTEEVRGHESKEDETEQAIPAVTGTESTTPQLVVTEPSASGSPDDLQTSTEAGEEPTAFEPLVTAANGFSETITTPSDALTHPDSEPKLLEPTVDPSLVVDEPITEDKRIPTSIDAIELESQAKLEEPVTVDEVATEGRETEAERAEPVEEQAGTEPPAVTVEEPEALVESLHTEELVQPLEPASDLMAEGSTVHIEEVTPKITVPVVAEPALASTEPETTVEAPIEHEEAQTEEVETETSETLEPADLIVEPEASEMPAPVPVTEAASLLGVPPSEDESSLGVPEPLVGEADDKDISEPVLQEQGTEISVIAQSVPQAIAESLDVPVENTASEPEAVASEDGDAEQPEAEVQEETAVDEVIPEEPTAHSAPLQKSSPDVKENDVVSLPFDPVVDVSIPAPTTLDIHLVNDASPTENLREIGDVVLSGDASEPQLALSSSEEITGALVANAEPISDAAVKVDDLLSTETKEQVESSPEVDEDPTEAVEHVEISESAPSLKTEEAEETDPEIVPSVGTEANSVHPKQNETEIDRPLGGNGEAIESTEDGVETEGAADVDVIEPSEVTFENGSQSHITEPKLNEVAPSEPELPKPVEDGLNESTEGT
ncbi:hypothetical protein BDP27DRAFT_1311218 [Rhodocollybia butyracea]|uniref:Rho-GAP domain-containing protein n=1 Tax=Rhodocollybia butyracea TaxID=206335 RepID=A0A9P5UFQ9_9AGAR|nr:hypothetical protein BDP27DRAFT_1311218 [Rhodocollybia butyracea]